MKFSHHYKLKKDLPDYRAGWKLRWSGSRERFYPYLPSKWDHDNGEPSIYLDYEHKGFTLDQIQDTEWFEVTGELVEFVPNFPLEKALEEYMCLVPDLRLVADVDESRCIGKMLDDKKFQKSLYEFYRDSYNKFYNLS